MGRIRLLLACGLSVVAAVAAAGCAKDSGNAGSGGRSGGGTGSGGAGASGSGGSTTTAGSGGAVGSGGATPIGSGGATGSGSGGATGSGSGGANSSGSGGGTVSNPDAGGGDAGTCQQAQYKFEPQIPTVYVLVDRSGTVFSSGVYGPLRSAVLQVVEQLQGEVRFGLGVFTGINGVCPTLNSVPAALNNYGPLSTTYNMLGDPMTKAETPASAVIPMVKSVLQADTSPGQKYVLFVTDTETDYCDDGGQACPRDSVLYRIQDLYAAGIGTFILGLIPATLGEATVRERTAALQAFANAGAGQPIGEPPIQGGQPPQLELYNQCAGNNNWRTIWTAAGRTGSVPTATYQAPAGNAMVYTPNPTNQAALANAISAVIAGVKSCTFDLGNVGGRAIKVDLNQLDKAHVLIEGAEVPRNETNGWRMNTQTELELAGTACTTWRMPSNTEIDFQFPCDAIIFE